MPLKTELNLADPDGLYEALNMAHAGLTAEASAAFNARLVLLLANHIGDVAVLRAAIAAAATAGTKKPETDRRPE